MTHKELHEAVRDLIRENVSKPCAFAVSVRSNEFHPGRVVVKWAIAVTTGERQPISVESIYPKTALRQLADLLREEQLPGLEPLDTIGEAPPSAVEPSVELSANGIAVSHR